MSLHTKEEPETPARPNAAEVLQIAGLSKVYRSRSGPVHAIDRLDFSVREFEFVSVVGPSGCGKTTLLKCVSGLLRPTTGTASLDGQVISGPPLGLAIVFQDYSRSLFPWMTVAKNIGLPLRRNNDKQAVRTAVHEALSAVGLEGFSRHFPWQLSGGMQQRVAIARALAYRPHILLLDEPFASVDAQTRADLEDLVLRVRREFGVTILLVTHDIDEAVYMSDRVVILSGRPSSIVETVDIDLPAERDQITTKELPEFAHLRTHVYRRIRCA